MQLLPVHRSPVIPSLTAVSFSVLASLCTASASVSFRPVEKELHDWVVAGLAWAPTSASTQPDSLHAFLSQFERIFDRLNHAGCAGDAF